MVEVVRHKESTNIPRLMACPVSYLGLDPISLTDYDRRNSILSGLRIFHHICEGCDKSGTVGNRNLQARSGASGIVRSEIVREPVNISASSHCRRCSEKRYQPITAGALGKTPENFTMS